MARVTAGIFFTGNVGGLCFYRMDGRYYVRRASSLRGERVKKDPRFAASQRRAVQFGAASRIARALYPMLPEKEKRKGSFGRLTAIVYRLLIEGLTEKQILKKLFPGKKTKKPRQVRKPKRLPPPSIFTIPTKRNTTRTIGLALHTGTQHHKSVMHNCTRLKGPD